MKMFLFHSAARLSANFLLALSVYLERTFLSGLFPTFDFILDIFLFAIFFPRHSDEIALFSYQTLVVNTIPNEIAFVHAKHIFMAK